MHELHVEGMQGGAAGKLVKAVPPVCTSECNLQVENLHANQDNSGVHMYKWDCKCEPK
jgi:hypothetical protein